MRVNPRREGDEMIFIDHAELPTIIGTGSEDYFGNAWGYQEAFTGPESNWHGINGSVPPSGST
jgi:hypothetical protein